MRNKESYLKQYFGYDSFREGQSELIDSVLSGRDALGIMPTGGGKSMCYQIPALMLNGVTLVISPLISLMKDQVMALKNAGVSAAYINSSLSYSEYLSVLRDMETGVLRLIYVAPERLEKEDFVLAAMRTKISFVAVDEAHCISQWGQEFRPSYLRIPEFLACLSRRPVVAAYTATATERVREDIIDRLGLCYPLKVVTGFDRPNLRFEVRTPAVKTDELCKILEERRAQSGIVYCATRKTVEKICNFLKTKGYAATRYHAGLDLSERTHNQEEFIYDEKTVMVATCAFGMGIDKSNVSYVIHYNMPQSLEQYYQEAGRAGRDGSPADCILLYAAEDIATVSRLIRGANGNEWLSEDDKDAVIFKNYRLLDHMVAYCKTTSCLRGHILSYFGQNHGERCENCGNCSSVFVTEDVTVEVQKILSCVRRASSMLGYSIGKSRIMQVLMGSRDKQLLSMGLDRLTTYGIMKDCPKERLRLLIHRLEEEGCLYVDSEFGGLYLTREADRFLFDTERFITSFRSAPAKEPRSRKKNGRETNIVVSKSDERLYEVLRALRHRIAQEEKVPAYIVFTNVTLSDMCEKRPHSVAEFRNVSGVGQTKLKKYAAQFLEAIEEFEKSECSG